MSCVFELLQNISYSKKQAFSDLLNDIGIQNKRSINAFQCVKILNL